MGDMLYILVKKYLKLNFKINDYYTGFPEFDVTQCWFNANATPPLYFNIILGKVMHAYIKANCLLNQK